MIILKENSMAIVYRHRRLDTNEVFYVGISRNQKRPYNKSGRTDWWKSITAKAGYSVEIIYDNIDIESAKELEELLIKEYGRMDLGLGRLVNMTDGGDGGKGNTSYIRTEEHKQKISAVHKGKTISEEHRLKIKLFSLNRKLSDKSKKQLSKNKLGTLNTNTVVILNLETGIYYNGTREASDTCNVTNGNLYAMLSENKPNRNTTSFQRV
jgi:hypothetical protein